MKKLMAIMMLFCATAQAEEAQLENIRVDTSVPAVERGADLLMNACHNCHTLKYLKYRDLVSYGLDKKKVDAWRGDQPPDAALVSLLPDESAMQMFGKIPPDLSLMTKAREGGVNYVYSYLIGYYITPEGLTGNHVFPETKMPDVLGMSGMTDPAQRAALQGKARDIVSFLAWAADPHREERRQLGQYVMIYLFVMTLLLFAVKLQIWSRLKS